SDTFYKIDNTEAVTSVNGHQGVVSLTYNDVSAHPNTWVPSWAQVTGKPADYTPSAHTHLAAEITDLTFDTSHLLPLAGGTMSGDIKMTEGNVFGRGIYWGSGYAEGYIRQSTAQGTIEIGTSDSLTIKHSSTNGVAATINTISATFSGIIYANSNKRVFADDYHPNADQLTTARNITLGGDLSGSVSFDGSANVTLTATVSDNTHNHAIANVTGLQTELDAKADNSHNHDAAYYTQAQVDAIVATLQARLDALEAKTAQQSVTGTTTIFSGEVQATDISIGN
ncbi:tail fiber protein, partial [Endozoicomonas atrinae]|uniref:tail fiber protein n=1 Tax=Endozoicomonas atrinae TaxID=1333660 RepID=UPI000B303B2B